MTVLNITSPLLMHKKQEATTCFDGYQVGGWPARATNFFGSCFTGRETRAEKKKPGSCFTGRETRAEKKKPGYFQELYC